MYFTKLKCCLLLFICASLSNCLENENELTVPKPVMNFILNCRQMKQSEEVVPVLKTNIGVDGETVSQQVSLLGIDELRSSLSSAVESEDVTDHIINRIREQLAPNGPSFRTEFCPPTTTTLNISVPPQELTMFHLRMERVLQQNNNVLLGQINDLITSKSAPIQKALGIITNTETPTVSPDEDLKPKNETVPEVVRDSVSASKPSSGDEEEEIDPMVALIDAIVAEHDGKTKEDSQSKPATEVQPSSSDDASDTKSKIQSNEGTSTSEATENAKKEATSSTKFSQAVESSSSDVLSSPLSQLLRGSKFRLSLS